MVSEFCRTAHLSTDGKYFFLENSDYETDGYTDLNSLYTSEEVYTLGFGTDTRYYLTPNTLVYFNTETENTND